MIAYVKRWAMALIEQLEAERSADLFERMRVLVEELNRLDPRDFVADAQFRFLEVRLTVRQWVLGDPEEWQRLSKLGVEYQTLEPVPEPPADSLARYPKPDPWEAPRRRIVRLSEGEKPPPTPEEIARQEQERRDREWVASWQRKHELGSQLEQLQPPLKAAIGMCHAVIDVLDFYGGPGSQGATRSSSFIHSPKQRARVERDYRELSLILFPGGAWKSSVILAGSILEAILNDVLTHDPQRERDALQAYRTRTKGKSKPIEQWGLQDLIQVATDLTVLPESRATMIDTVLRNYRNFVYPRVEDQEGYPCTEAEAKLASGG